VTLREKQAKKSLKLDVSRTFVKTMRLFEIRFCEKTETERPVVVPYICFFACGLAPFSTV